MIQLTAFTTSLATRDPPASGTPTGTDTRILPSPPAPDSDPLYLGRVGIIPAPHRMCTDFAREIAAAGSVDSFLAAHK